MELIAVTYTFVNMEKETILNINTDGKQIEVYSNGYKGEKFNLDQMI